MHVPLSPASWSSGPCVGRLCFPFLRGPQSVSAMSIFQKTVANKTGWDSGPRSNGEHIGWYQREGPGPQTWYFSRFLGETEEEERGEGVSQDMVTFRGRTGKRQE